MAQAEQSRTSRSLAIYGLLLELYPRPYLQQHRAEMLQNFQDLEQASPSKAELWLFLARDLAVSLRSQFTKTLWGQTTIVVLVLAIVLAYTERHAVARRHPTEGCCLGYILGWFTGWFGKQWQASSTSRAPSHIRSLPAQAMIVVSLLVLVIAVTAVGSGAQNHVVWALCYGFLLAWIAGWVGNRRQTRP
jgi:uncharacterized membrane protein YbaN (DUF454 family)